jgi:hypothetical protein
MPAEVPKAEEPTDVFTDNTKKLAELKASFDPDKDDLEAYRAERSKLIQENENYSKTQEEANVDNEMFDAHTEANQMNKDLDSAKAQAEEAARLKAEADMRAKQAEQDQAARAEELEAAAALIERIKSGKVETRQGESVGAQGVSVERGRTEIPLGSKDEAIDERPIEERLEASKTEMSEKYGETIRRAAKELAGVVKEMRSKDAELRTLEYQSPEWKKANGEYNVLNDRRNKLRDEATWNTEILRNQKSGESWSDYSNYQGRTLAEYQRTAHHDPQAVLSLAEAGELSEQGPPSEGLGIGRVSKKLRSNKEYMTRMLDVLDRTGAQSFWAYTMGEARQDKDLYLTAVRKNHLNYQFGPKEWTTDPEVQKIALESGLDRMYLQK